MPKYIISICMLLILGLKVQGQKITLPQNEYAFNGLIQILREEGKPLTVSEALSKYHQQKFKPVETRHNNLNIGYVQSVYWVAIPVENQTSKTLELESGISRSGIFNIEFSQINPETKQAVSWPITGANYAFESRAVNSRFYYFPVVLPPGQKSLLLYRIDQRGSNLHAPLKLFDKEYRAATELRITVVYSFFCGLIIFASFFSFVTFLWFKDRLYLYYSLYTFLSCLFILSDSNLASVWLYPSWQSWNSIATSMYAGWLALFRISVTNEFLHLKESQKRLFRFNTGWIFMMLILTLLIPLVFIGQEYLRFRPVIYVFGVICFLGEWAIHAFAIITMVIRKYKPAYLYGISILSVFLISMIYNVKNLNLTYVKELPYYYFPVGLTIEIVILSFALVYKFHFHRKQHSELQLNFQKEVFKTQLEIQEHTLQNISQEIHDNIGQVLSLIKLNLNTLDFAKPAETLEKANQSNELLTQAIHDLRELSHNLNSDFIADIGLVKAIEHQLLVFQKSKIYTTSFIITGKCRSYSNDKELVLFRIVQELLNNILKHAQANHVEISFVFNTSSMLISIADNGIGFDINSIYENDHQGIGLHSIKKRISLINGTCEIKSDSNTGTKVNIYLKSDH